MSAANTLKSAKMSDHDYFTHPSLNCSTFKPFLVSPKQFRYELDKKDHDKKDGGKTLGSMAHCLFLEPWLFNERYYEYNKTKGLDTKAAAEFKLSLPPGAMIYTPEMLRKAEAMIFNIGTHPLPAPYKRELVCFNTILGVPCKAKADWIGDDGYIWDLKVTRNLRNWEYTDLRTYQYKIQAQWYMILFSGIQPKGFKWLVVSNEPPYDFRIFNFSRDSQVESNEIIRDGMERYKECLKTGEWPGIHEENDDETDV